MGISLREKEVLVGGNVKQKTFRVQPFVQKNREMKRKKERKEVRAEVTPTPLTITVYFLSLFCSFLLSFFLSFFFSLWVFLTKGCTRNAFYFTFLRTKTSFSRKSPPPPPPHPFLPFWRRSFLESKSTQGHRRWYEQAVEAIIMQSVKDLVLIAVDNTPTLKVLATDGQNQNDSRLD